MSVFRKAVRRRLELAPEDREQAVDWLTRLRRLVSVAYPDLDAEKFTALACAAIREIYSGRAAETGLQLDNLCRTADVNPGRIRESFGPRWQQAGELVVRLLTARLGETVSWERISVVPVPVRSTYHGLGTDRIHGKGSGIRVILGAVCNGDRCLAASSRIYTTGTRDDHTCVERCEHDRIQAFEAECDMPIAGTMAEHVSSLLRQRAAVVRRIERAIGADARRPGIGRVAAESHADLLILDAFPQGPARARGALHGKVRCPGDDEATMQALQGSGLSGIAMCSETALEAAEDERDHWVPLEVEPGTFSMQHGVHLAPWNVGYHHVPARSMVVREETVEHNVLSRGWRMFGPHQDLALAASLGALAHERWPRDCIERAAAAGAWGRLSVTGAWCHAALRTVLHVADAALVNAERDRKAREMRSRDH